MDQVKLAKCFNEWMRRFIEEPDRYTREFQRVAEFQRQELAGEEPTYGQNCAAYLAELAGEIA